MDKTKKKRNGKELSKKIAEIIWLSIGGIFMVAGLASLVLSAFINNMDGNFKVHPFYPLYQFETSFFTWMNSWMKSKINSFLVLGMILVAISMVYLLIVFIIYANKQDVNDKKLKARKLREKNLKKFEEERLAAEKQAKEQAALDAQKKAEAKENSTVASIDPIK